MLSASFRPIMRGFGCGSAVWSWMLFCTLFLVVTPSIETAMLMKGHVITAVAAAADPEPLYILNLIGAKGEDRASTKYFAEGFKAALYANPNGANNRPIQLIEPENANFPLAITINKALEAYPSLLGMVGPMSDETLEEAVSYTKEFAPTLTAIGPYTYYHEARTWNMQKYFLRAPPVLETYGLVSYLVQVMHVRRVGLMYLTGSAFSEVKFEQIKTALYSVHQIVPIEYSKPYTDTTVNVDAFQAFAEQRPQAIIVYAVAGDATTAFVKECGENALTKAVPIFFLGGGAEVVYRTIPNGEESDHAYQYYFASTNLFPTSSEFQHIQTFERELRAYIKDHESTSFIVQYEQVASSLFGGVTVAGWLTGKILQQTLRDPVDITDRETYQRSLFNLRRYLVEGEVPIGTYAGECSAYARVEQSICECNQGGHTIHVNQISSAQPVPTRAGSFTFNPNECYSSTTVKLPFYAQGLILAYQDNEYLQNAAGRLAVANQVAIQSVSSTEVDLAISVLSMDSVENLTLHTNDYLLDVILGPVKNAKEVVNNYLGELIVMDPIDQYPVPRIGSPLVLYLMPTMEQQIYLTAQLIQEQKLSYAVLLRTDNPYYTSIQSMIHNAAQVFSITIDIFDMEDSESLRKSFHHDYVTIIGLPLLALPSIKSDMEKFPHRIYSLLYEDFSLYYEDILSAFDNATDDVKQRLVTQTNLPLWTDFSEDSAAEFPELQAYHRFFAEKDNTDPVSLQAWYTNGVLNQILSSQYGNTTRSLQECIYRYTWYNFGGVDFGKIDWDEDACGKDPNGPSCLNYGASNINVVSLARVLDPTVPVYAGPFNPVITKPEGSLLNLNVALAVIIPIMVVCCVLAALALYLYCWKRSRNNRAAPKDADKPVTLMFTDIQSSTSLWATYPEEMAAAMDVHHSIIRKQIALHQCYEVKTIGDSFMVASHDPWQVVQLASAIQHALHAYDWGTRCFDKFYVQSAVDEKEKFDDGAGGGAPLALQHSMKSDGGATQVAFAEDYEKIWNGLRVRMGMHTGFCDIRFDETTKGYDYYGDTVNTAARTESVADGGQVLMTKSTLDACEDEDSSRLQEVSLKDVGAHSLRGVPHPVNMFELEVLPGRVFKAISADEGESSSDADEYESESCSQSTGQTSRVYRNPMAETIFKVFNGALSPFPVKKRSELLKTFMSQWRISASKTKNVDEEMGFRLSLLRFANRTSKIVAHREGVVNLLGSGTFNGSTREVSLIGAGGAGGTADDNFRTKARRRMSMFRGVDVVSSHASHGHQRLSPAGSTSSVSESHVLHCSAASSHHQNASGIVTSGQQSGGVGAIRSEAYIFPFSSASSTTVSPAVGSRNPLPHQWSPNPNLKNTNTRTGTARTGSSCHVIVPDNTTGCSPRPAGLLSDSGSFPRLPAAAARWFSAGVGRSNSSVGSVVGGASVTISVGEEDWEHSDRLQQFAQRDHVGSGSFRPPSSQKLSTCGGSSARGSLLSAGMNEASMPPPEPVVSWRGVDAPPSTAEDTTATAANNTKVGQTATPELYENLGGAMGLRSSLPEEPTLTLFSSQNVSDGLALIDFQSQDRSAVNAGALSITVAPTSVTDQYSTPRTPTTPTPFTGGSGKPPRHRPVSRPVTALAPASADSTGSALISISDSHHTPEEGRSTIEEDRYQPSSPSVTRLLSGATQGAGPGPDQSGTQDRKKATITRAGNSGGSVEGHAPSTNSRDRRPESVDDFSSQSGGVVGCTTSSFEKAFSSVTTHELPPALSLSPVTQHAPAPAPAPRPDSSNGSRRHSAANLLEPLVIPPPLSTLSDGPASPVDASKLQIQISSPRPLEGPISSASNPPSLVTRQEQPLLDTQAKAALVSSPLNPLAISSSPGSPGNPLASKQGFPASTPPTKKEAPLPQELVGSSREGATLHPHPDGSLRQPETSFGSSSSSGAAASFRSPVTGFPTPKTRVGLPMMSDSPRLHGGGGGPVEERENASGGLHQNRPADPDGDRIHCDGNAGKREVMGGSPVRPIRKNEECQDERGGLLEAGVMHSRPGSPTVRSTWQPRLPTEGDKSLKS